MNIPGIFSIEYFETEKYNLPTLRANSSVKISDYVADPLDKLEFIPDTASLLTKPTETDNGIFETITINFKIAGHAPATLEELKNIQKKFRSFVITDKTKQKYLLGDKNGARPALAYELKNDATGSGGRSINAVITLVTTVFPVYATE